MKLLSDLMSYKVPCDVEIHDVSSHSNDISHGSLFVAVSGHVQEGVNYIPEAIERGAVAIVAEENKKDKVKKIMEGDTTPVIWVENARKALSHIASKFYERQPEHCVAVTGTSGKSSVVWFVRQILEGLGCNAASLGTIGVHAQGFFEKSSLTTADPVALHKSLRDLSKRGVEYLAMEASSIGIEQCRLDGVKLKAAAFTNLSHEHLDYHDNMGAYFKAKQRLFTQCLDHNGCAILNADIPEFKPLLDICTHHNIKTIPYGIHAKAENAVILVNRSVTENGQDLILSIGEKTLKFSLPLVGSFQVQNILCAVAIASALREEELDLSALPEILSTIKPVPGRLERIEGHPQKAKIYVDYAHKPAALEAVLTAVAPHTQGKLWLVFGCGGDRDRAKRSKMAQIAFNLADEVIVTDDNPRTENPVDIRTEITAGFPSFQNIGDRRAAIDCAISSLQMGDSLIIAGKGHESGQTINTQTLLFDDRDETRHSIQSLDKTYYKDRP